MPCHEMLKIRIGCWVKQWRPHCSRNQKSIKDASVSHVVQLLIALRAHMNHVVLSTPVNISCLQALDTAKQLMQNSPEHQQKSIDKRCNPPVAWFTVHDLIEKWRGNHPDVSFIARLIIASLHKYSRIWSHAM